MLGGQGFPSSRQTSTTACGLRPLYNVCLASLKGKSRYCSHSVGIIFVQLHAMLGCHLLSVCWRITSANLFHVSGKGKVRLTFLRLCLIFFFKFKGEVCQSHICPSIHSLAMYSQQSHSVLQCAPKPYAYGFMHICWVTQCALYVYMHVCHTVLWVFEALRFIPFRRSLSLEPKFYLRRKFHSWLQNRHNVRAEMQYIFQVEKLRRKGVCTLCKGRHQVYAGVRWCTYVQGLSLCAIDALFWLQVEA